MPGSGRGPPKHQNRYSWKPNAGHKKNETELGGKSRPYSEITGVCQRCKDQIEWKRRYGKYKPLAEPKKCSQCGKRAVRQAHHNICSACAKERKVCAKCCCHVERIVGRDVDDEAAERKELEEAIRNARERDRRTLLRAMNKNRKGVPVTSNAAAGKQSTQSSEIHEHDDGGCTETSENDEDDDNLLRRLSIEAGKQASKSSILDDNIDSDNDDENDEHAEINYSDENNDDDPCH
ncbi:unnamed protein product [Victoria cruziana]